MLIIKNGELSSLTPERLKPWQLPQAFYSPPFKVSVAADLDMREKMLG